MRETIALLFYSGAAASLLSFCLSLFKMKKAVSIFLTLAVILMVVSCTIRIILNWPLVTLFQEAYVISSVTGMITIFIVFILKKEKLLLPLVGLTASVSVFTVFFPGDIYVSFLKTNTVFAHLYSVLTSGARAAYLISFAISMYAIIAENENSSIQSLLRYNTNLIIAGFAMQSIGMFSGAMWSFVGWGNPVQWQSQIFLGMAGLWFYYSWYLHLKIGRKSEGNLLFRSSAAGGFLTIIFTYLPETGNFAIPEVLR